MTTYAGVAHVRWELPFLLRLPADPFLCWEPGEGLALLAPLPAVGTTTWQRRCSFLSTSRLFPDVPEEPAESYPQRCWMQVVELDSGERHPILKIDRGEDGGFHEARPYTVANLFLCLQRREDYADRETRLRAAGALNNVIEVYRFVTMDPLPRPIHWEDDNYCTSVSFGAVPEGVDAEDPRAILRNTSGVGFGCTVGEDRAYTVGLNSYEDLRSGGPLAGGHYSLLRSQVTSQRSLELFMQLFLAAIRRLKRREYAFAVIDAQSAFEALVATVLREQLQAGGLSPDEVDERMDNLRDLLLLKSRLRALDQIASREGGAAFLSSEEHERWERDLYGLRNSLVHAGRREVTFSEAKAAVAAGLSAVDRIQSLAPTFRRRFNWSGDATDLEHVHETAGRLFRIFEM